MSKVDCTDPACYCHGDPHFCEIGHPFPSRLGQSWTCPECGRPWVTERAVDSEPGIQRLVERGTISPDAICWHGLPISP